MENLPKVPTKDIQQDCEKKYKDWIVALIDTATAVRNPKKKIDIAESYEEMLQLFA